MPDVPLPVDEPLPFVPDPDELGVEPFVPEDDEPLFVPFGDCDGAFPLVVVGVEGLAPPLAGGTVVVDGGD